MRTVEAWHYVFAPDELIMGEWVGDMRGRDVAYSGCFGLVVELLLDPFAPTPHTGSAFEDLPVAPAKEVLLESVVV